MMLSLVPELVSAVPDVHAAIVHRKLEMHHTQKFSGGVGLRGALKERQEPQKLFCEWRTFKLCFVIHQPCCFFNTFGTFQPFCELADPLSTFPA